MAGQPSGPARLASRVAVWLLTHTIYRVRTIGAAHVPASGAALLVANHLSFADALLVASRLRRPARFLVHRTYFEHGALRWIFRGLGAMPVSAGSPAANATALTAARDALERGEVVCIFAEGPVSRRHDLLGLSSTYQALAAVPAPVVPVYLDRVLGGGLRFRGRHLSWDRPRAMPFPVTIGFGPPLPASTPASSVRFAVGELGAEILQQRHSERDTLGRHFIRTARRRFFHLTMADSTGRRVTFGRALVGALLLAKWLRASTQGQPTLALLLPSSVAGALVNIATVLSGKIPVNLNFTAGTESMTHAIAQCDIRTIVTSRQFLSKAALPTLPGMVYLEDIVPAVMKPAAMAAMFVRALLLPPDRLLRMAGSGTVQADDTATIIFSSGSTGVPKGVVLSHRNILANLDSVEQVVEARDDDVLIGVLPFFHSFGFTGTLWFPVLAGFAVVYHPNPMDARTVGELTAQYRGTMLISTPTFCSSYVRKCAADQLQTLRYAIVGAEKLREPVARAFKDKFGVELLEGYGCTEMAPVVCANLPRVNEAGSFEPTEKFGSVGRPLPGVVAKVVDPDTGEGPLIGAPGLLLVKGANRMVGYLDDATRTTDALRDGWYVTGDIAIIDEDGAIFITDRLSRFSKIAGEMVPHMKVEELVAACLADTCTAAVTGIPDEMKGERLVAFYTDPAVTPQALWEALCRTDLPRLWIPKREDLRFIDAIPTLGTGKVDLRAVRTLALEPAQRAVS